MHAAKVTLLNPFRNQINQIIKQFNVVIKFGKI